MTTNTESIFDLINNMSAVEQMAFFVKMEESKKAKLAEEREKLVSSLKLYNNDDLISDLRIILDEAGLTCESLFPEYELKTSESNSDESKSKPAREKRPNLFWVNIEHKGINYLIQPCIDENHKIFCKWESSSYYKKNEDLKKENSKEYDPNLKLKYSTVEWLNNRKITLKELAKLYRIKKGIKGVEDETIFAVKVLDKATGEWEYANSDDIEDDEAESAKKLEILKGEESTSGWRKVVVPKKK